MTAAPARQHTGTRRLALRLARGTAWIFTGRMASRGATLLVNVVAAKILVPSAVGALLLTNTVVLIGAMVARWGMDFAAVRLVARSAADGEWARARASLASTFLGTIVGSGIAAAVLLGGGWRWLALHGFHSADMASLQTSAALLLVVTAIQQTVSSWFRALQRMRVVALFDELLANALWFFALISVWAVDRTPSLNAIVWLRTGALLLVLMWMVALFRKPYGGLAGTGGARPTVRELLDLGSTLMVTNLVLLVVGTTSDMVVLGVYRSKAQVAAYGLAASLSALVAAPFMAATVAFVPALAEARDAADRARLERPLRAIVAAVSLPAILIAAIYAVIGASILGLAFGAHYRGAAHVLAILSLAQVVFVVTGPCGGALAMMDRQRVAFALALASAAASVGGDVFAAPRWGGTGVAVATSSALAASNVVTALVAKRLTGISTVARFGLADLRTAVDALRMSMARREPLREEAGLGSE